MKKLLLILLLLGTSPLLASMTCTVSATPGTSWPYSPYTIHVTDTDADSIAIWNSYGIEGVSGNNDTFNTFCIEQAVTFRPGTPYTATIDSSVLHGGGYPQLQQTTQKIYAAYLNGAFGSEISEIKIQKAIWQSQANNGNLNTFLVGSLDGLDVSGWNNVRALNLWQGEVYTGKDIQSQLVRINVPSPPPVIVPIPGALTLGGLGMVLTGWMRKRKTI